MSLRDAVMRKGRESARTIEAFFQDEAERIVTCAQAMAKRFDAGGKLLSFGNGGSSCDAAHAAVEFMHPVFTRRPAIEAMALGAETALLTAIGNDDDFSFVYARALELHGKPGDVALAISTSGQSASVIRALESARRLDMITVGLSGRDGGRVAALSDHAFVVPSFSIHRIQEAHITLLHVLWDMVHVVRGEEDIVG
jgi:D-sedoheptulose 7-phosphate isomerase